MNVSSRILYVDDDDGGRDMMSAWLQQDYQVTTASGGRYAKELMQRMRFDLFILDYFLPDMTAVDLCMYIRSISLRVPIVIYSALARSEYRSAVLAAGGTEYLIKPNDLERLIPTIIRCLGSTRKLPRNSMPRRRAASIL